MSFVRSSKYRHIFGTPFKNDQCFTGVKVTRSSADSSFCAVNPKFIAIVVQGAGGGPFLVLPLDKVGRVTTKQPVLNGHSQQVMGLAFSPFNDNLLASCSEDCSIKLWEIPDEGITQSDCEPWVELAGHVKRVTLLEWHPTVEYVLASAGVDCKVFVWNVLESEQLYRFEFPDAPTCISWNFNGSLLATTCKDKALRVLDVRKENVIAERKKCFEGSKPAKCVFVKGGRIFTVGFGRMSTRQYALWNEKDLTEPIVLEDVDNSSGTVYLFNDPDSGVVYTVGKGDSTIKYYEIDGSDPYVHFLSAYSATTSQRGVCWMPKRALDVASCEIARFYKLTEDKCEPVSFVVPRKSDLFQEDIFPPCASGEPALTVEQWTQGKDADPKTIDMKTLFQQGKTPGAKKSGAKPTRLPSQRAPRPNGTTLPPAEPTLPPGVNLEELCEDVKKLKATVRKVCRRVTALEKQLGEAVGDDVNEEEE